ncbi:hypothetical protein AVEN_35277-1 [Araneus ventricosus]|uniref:Uncharacterized protein n=1 Tax=Araneus ventricosus TaxID=182803 RepID=A0A4Y2EFL0_ARAVE|nr:hypothetical protein AVEN_35277-1 [Araneus ventricosus]
MIKPFDGWFQNLMQIYNFENKSIVLISSIELFSFSSYRVHVEMDGRTDRLPGSRFGPKFERTLQICRKDFISNLKAAVSCAFELLCSQTSSHNPKYEFLGIKEV